MFDPERKTNPGSEMIDVAPESNEVKLPVFKTRVEQARIKFEILQE